MKLHLFPSGRLFDLAIIIFVLWLGYHAITFVGAAIASQQVDRGTKVQFSLALKELMDRIEQLERQ